MWLCFTLAEVKRTYVSNFKCARSSYITQRNLLGLKEAEHGKHQNLFMVIMVDPDQTLFPLISVRFSRCSGMSSTQPIGPAENRT